MKTLNQLNPAVGPHHNWSRIYTVLSFAFTSILFFLFGYFFQMITVL